MKRIRPKWSDEELARIYAVPHNHHNWLDHEVRVGVTLGVARLYGRVESAADLSCGNGWLLDRIDAKWKHYGDFAPGYSLTGPIEQTIHQISAVELFILSETIEHVDDPELVLSLIRAKTDKLILSTPLDESLSSANEQHYWSWTADDMRELLTSAGFTVDIYNELQLNHYEYDFQIWACT